MTLGTKTYYNGGGGGGGVNENICMYINSIILFRERIYVNRNFQQMCFNS